MGANIFQMYVGNEIGPVALEFLRVERVVLISSGEMNGSKQMLSTLNLRIPFLVNLFWYGLVSSFSLSRVH